MAVVDLDPSVSSANSAHSSAPPPHSSLPSNGRDVSHLTASLAPSATSPAASSRSAAGSPARQLPSRDAGVAHPSTSLPALPKYRGAWESSTSSPEDKRAESSIYYTTAWGSPYAAPSTRRLSWSLSQDAGVGRGSGVSSPGSMHSGLHHDSEANNTDFLKPSVPENSAQQLYSGVFNNRSPGRGDQAGKKGGKSIKDFTQDWINQYLSGQPRTERGNWLSDDSGSEAPSFFTAKNNLAEDPADDWLGLDQDIRDEDVLRTPTLSDFIGRRVANRSPEGTSAGRKAKDLFHKRTDTLRQEDFWGFAYDKDPQPITMSDTKDEQPPTSNQEPTKMSSPTEKPLPPPPVDSAQEAPPTQETSKPPSEPKPAEPPKPVDIQPARKASSTPQLQRPKKKLVWRGKACVIALPLEDKRGSKESGRRLLTAEDVEQRLKKWEEEGYDTRGFSVSAPEDPTDVELGGLSREAFPNQAEGYDEYKAGNYGVRIPNKDEWDAYVNFLQEEKLRALGVDLGGGEEEIQPQPSVSPAMGQMAPFPGLVSSPPIPTASAGSNPLGIPHPFSPHLNQSTNTSNGMPSLASPASQFSVQTPFMGVDQNMLPGFHMPFQPTPPAQGSLTPQSFFNNRHVSNPSTIGGGLPNLSSMLSPVSPFHEQGAFHPGLNEPGPAKDIYSGDHMDMGMQDNMADMRPIRTPTEQPDNFHASNVEIAQPTPRGHSRGHNLSETLQKGLDQLGPSDYHLEESIERQLDEGDREPSHNFSNRNLHHLPQHVQQFYQGNYQDDHHAHEGSDIDTNPSLSGAPQRHGTLSNNIPWHEPKPSAGSYGGGHRSKLSTSTLNVDAKEFDPSASMSSQQNPFQANAFQFPQSNNSVFTFGSGQGFKPSSSAFHASAPSFAPSHTGTNNRSVGSGEFKFSSPSFNVQAPVFNPSASGFSATSDQPSSGRTKIFGDIDFNEISKPTKKSKAVPIVRPDSGQDKKGDEEEAEPAQPSSTDRHKRARRVGGSSDQEIEFSQSGNALAENNNAQATQAPAASHMPAEGKENTSPEKDAEHTPVPTQENKTVERKDTPVSEASTWQQDTKDEGTAAVPEQHKAQTFEEILRNQGQPVNTTAAKSADQSSESKEEERPEDKPEAKPSFFSRAAKHFTFKPSVAEFVPFAAKQPSNEPESAPKPKNDLMASRYAVTSPEKELSVSDLAQPKDSGEHNEPEAASEAKQAPEQDSDEGGSPDEAELNAIMEQLNESDAGIERVNTPHATNRAPESSVVAPSKEKKHGPAEIRDEAPSPSPGRGQIPHVLNVPKLDFDAQSQASATPSKSFISRYQSPVRQLVNQNEHISDWDDIISSGEDEKLVNRSRFFDRRINDLVGSAVEERLSPLERALSAIQQSVTAVTSGTQSKFGWRSTSAEAEDSDADDEDDEFEEHTSIRAKSPLQKKSRKLEQLKNAISEVMAIRESEQGIDKSGVSELAQLRENVAELQRLTVQRLSHDPTAEMREMIQDVVSTQLSQQQPRPSDAEEIGADSLMLQIDGLKNMLRVTDERAEKEYKLRREAQDSVAELQRFLRLVEEDATRHSAAAESAEARLLEFKQEKIPYFEQIQFRADNLEQDHATLKLTLAEVSSKNIHLEGTLDEYRVSSDNWKRESERAKGELEEARAENKKLNDSIDHLKVRIEDGLSIRQNLSEKLDHLQDEMANVTRDITRDQVSWRNREEEHIAKYNELNAAYSRELKLREKLETDISELEQQEREAAKLKFIFGQSQQENARLEELVAYLRVENHELQQKATHFEREFNEARETSRVEIQRTRTTMESELEASNSQVNIVRAELEAQISRLQGQLDNVRLDSDTAKERYEMLLEEANETKATAVAAAVEAKNVAIEDQRRLHERVLNDLRERHARALHNSSEDKARGESHLLDKLALSDEKAKHFQDRCSHLEEKLEIAQSAARAAAEAAQKGKAPANMPPAHASTPSLSLDKDSMVPERISPQALRESILVLQDQLQQRESRIEELEQEVSSVDKDAPNRMHEKDTEIGWLRELLDVRLGDLQDIIKTVSQPSFDHNAVRDAAIRLKANLQMQQQERERAMTGQSFPNIPSLSEITASPRALPLAAAAAWGNWRKGREGSASEQTPSKPSNASSFLSGLLTPPSSNMRQNSPNANAGPPAGWRRSSESRPLRNVNTTPRPLSARGGGLREPPKTPPLLRRSSYDHDAEPADYGENYGENSLGEDESTADGLVSASPKDTGDDGPFGPQISSSTS